MAVTQRIKNKNGEWVLVNNKGGGSTPNITVDSELSSESTNPIQNKTITQKLNTITNELNNKVEVLQIACDIDGFTGELINIDKKINSETFSKLLDATLLYGEKVLTKFLVKDLYNNELNAYLIPVSEAPELQEITNEEYVLFIENFDPKIFNGYKALLIIDKTGDVIFSNILGRIQNNRISIPSTGNYPNAVKLIDDKIDGMTSPYEDLYSSLIVHISVGGIVDDGVTIGPYYNNRSLHDDPVIGAQFTYISNITGKVYEVKLDKNSNMIERKELNVTEKDPSTYNIGIDDDIIVDGYHEVLDTDTLELFYSQDSRILNLNSIKASNNFKTDFGEYGDYNDIINSKIDTISIESTNVWDEKFETGKLDNGGNLEFAYEITSGFIPTKELGSLYLVIDELTRDFTIHYYDENKEHFHFSEVTVTKGIPYEIYPVIACKYIRFSTRGTYGAFYNNDIAVTEIESVKNYTPYGKIDVINVSSLFSKFEGGGLNRIGYVSDSIELGRGIVKRIGLRDYQDGDENNDSCIVNTPKTKTLYVLDTPEYTPLSSDEAALFLKPFVVKPGFIIRQNSEEYGLNPRLMFSYKNNLRQNVAELKCKLEDLLTNE